METQTNMNQPEQLFHLCQYTEKQGHQVVYELIGSQRRADETADEFNSALADRGVPGNVISWYVTGPHQQTTGNN